MTVPAPSFAKQKPNLRVVQIDAGEPMRLQRAHGSARIAFKQLGERTVLDDLYQAGCVKVRLPRTLAAEPPEAVLINTSGGLTDGDRLATSCTWHPETSAAITTQASERIYKARQRSARVTTHLTVDAKATAYWMPQDTIIFDGGRLERSLDITLHKDANLVACEAIVLGRPAMGETVSSGHLIDTWTIQQDGKRIFMDRLEMSGDMSAKLDRPGAGAGARALASVLVCGTDLEHRLAALQSVTATLPDPAGCSHLGAAVLVRLVAQSGYQLRKNLIRVLHAATEGQALPRVWAC